MRATAAGVVVSDDRGNEGKFWFADVLEASCQGLSDEGIEACFPGLLARLQAALEAVPAPDDPTNVEALARFASLLAASVHSICVTAQEREALGVPTRFSFQAVGPMHLPDLAALAQMRQRRN